MGSPGSSNRYQQIETLYQRAVDLPREQRSAFLRGACGADSQLIAEVETLLSHLDSAPPGYLESAVHNLESHTRVRVPQRVGSYTIVQLLGRGGMGTVYEAEQAQPHRSVALKLIRADALSPDTLRRFRHEADVLGQLVHPGIAQIYEFGVAPVWFGGVATDEQPYFAMELVRGSPLTAYVAAHRRAQPEILELFAQVCDAVHHAHKKGFIHRDLKPSNILVDEEGRPKVLDFGIARITGHGVETFTAHTSAGQLLGTLAYMSPEQLIGGSHVVDARSDVYSLGVMLYELLAGRLPYDLADKPIAAIARIVSEESPRPLSAVDRAFRGDLDTIVSKSLEKDPARRYATAADLATDLRRLVRREPISAHPPTALYRFRKFAQRNKALVGGVTATFVALILGIIGTSYGLIRMTQQRNEARLQARAVQAANDFLTDDLLELADPQNESNREITLREVLDRAAAKVKGRFPDAPMLEANLRKAIGKSYSHLNLLDKAETQLTKAAEMYRAAGSDRESDALLMRMELGALLMERAQFDRAEKTFLELLERQRVVLGPEHEQTIASLHNLGAIYAQTSRFPEAEQYLREALRLRLKVLGENNRHTAITMNVLGVISGYTGHMDEAIDLLTRAVDIHLRVSGEKHPDTLQTIGNLGTTYYSQKKYEQAEEVLTRAYEMHRRVLGDEHRQTLQFATNLASCYGALRKPEREPLLRKTLEIQRRVMGENHPDTLATGLQLARVAFDQKDFTAAEPQYRDLSARFLAATPGNWVTGVAFMLHGRCLMELEQYDEAETALKQSHAIFLKALGETHDRTRQSASELAQLYERWNKSEAALEWQARSKQGQAPAASAVLTTQSKS